LILGEEGVGKSLVAKTIHLTSSRRNSPFLSIHCERETSASFEVQLRSVLENWDKGTLYLESIASLGKKSQEFLLKDLLDAKSSLRKIRILAGNPKDFSEDLQTGHFFMELYVRLAEVPLRIPPLRDRRGDIPLLAQHFLWIFNRQYGTNQYLEPEKLKKLSTLPWTGNVRELQSRIQSLVVRGGDPYEERDLPSLQESPEEWNLDRALARLEAKMIEEALRRVGTQEEAAKLLGISRGALQYKLKNNAFYPEK